MKHTIFSALILALLATIPSGAQENCIDYNDYFHYVSGLEMPDGASLVALDGDVALVLNDGYLQFVDISDPNLPELIPSNDLYFDSPLEIATWEGYCLIADDDGLNHVDISDPAAPSIRGTLPLTGYVEGMALIGHTCPIACGSYGVYLVDWDDPNNMSVISTIDTPGDARNVAIGVNEEYIYVADGDAGLQVVDVTDLANPEIVATVPFGTYVAEIAVLSNDYLVLADYSLEFHIVDIHSPENAEPVVHMSLPDYPNDIATLPGIGIVTTDDCVVMWDLSTPTAPVLAYNYDGYGPVDVVAVDGFAYVTEYGPDAFEIFACLAPQPAQPLSYDDAVDAVDVARLGDEMAFVLDYDDEIWSYDISDPTLPTHEHTVAMTIDGRPDRIVGVNHHLYIAVTGSSSQWHGLHIYEVSSLTDFYYLGEVETPGYANELAVLPTEDYVYLADETDGLQVINTSNPTDPQIVNWIDLYDCYGVDVEGTLLFASEDNTVAVFDITNPADPQWLGQTDALNQEITSLDAQGDYVYALDYDNGFYVIDASNPAAPVLVGQPYLPQMTGYEVEVAGNYAYLASDTNGMYVVDVTDPTQPFFVGHGEGNGYAKGLGLDENYVYFADQDLLGFAIFPQQCDDSGDAPWHVTEPALRLVQNYPNPCISSTTFAFELPAAGSVRLDIVDVNGRMITILANGWQTAGQHQLGWSGVTSDGAQVSPGVYFARLALNDQIAMRKVIVGR